MRDETRVGLIEESIRWMWEPLDAEVFDFGDGAYLERGFEIYAEMVKRRITRHMPIFIWMNRMLFGVRALFYQLGARLPYRRLDAEERQAAGI